MREHRGQDVQAIPFQAKAPQARQGVQRGRDVIEEVVGQIQVLQAHQFTQLQWDSLELA